MMSFVLGGGCFWCLDSSFMQFAGVIDVEVGYAGGQAATADYETVCGGKTGHVEVARVNFDESVIPADVILDIFFTLHDPTQVDRQGNDVGTQYRTAMFYTEDTQRHIFAAAIERAKLIWGDGVVTSNEPLVEFFMGEEYHQDFFAKNPNQGYCNYVVLPKMQKTRKAFVEYVK